MTDLSKLRICFLAGLLTQGGAERQLFYILKTLRREGANLHLLCLTRGNFWEQRIQELGVSVTWVGRSKSRLVRLVQILKELRKHKPHVFQSQHFYTNTYVIAAARMLGLRDIGAMRSDGVNEVMANGWLFGRLNLHGPRLVAANSQNAIQYAVQQGVSASRLYFLPNVVDTEQFSPVKKNGNAVVTLIAVGRLGREKRLDRFLNILARLRKQACNDIKGLIIGSGRESHDLQPQLEQQAKHLGLMPGVVEFRGAVESMASVYQEAEICVLTSDYEGTPNVLLEAMASGLPVVSTRVGGVPGIVRQEETGLMAEPNDEDGMVCSLLRLINDSDLRTSMGARARKYIESHHSLDQLPGFLTKLYQLSLKGFVGAGLFACPCF